MQNHAISMQSNQQRTEAQGVNQNLDILQSYAPIEIWLYILSFEELAELVKLALVCRDLQTFANDQAFWKPIYQKTFNTNLFFEKEPDDYRVAFIERNRTDAIAAFEKLSTGLNCAAASLEFSFAENVKNVFVALKANQFGPRHALELIYAAHFMFDKSPNQIFIDDCNENPLLKRILQANPFYFTSDMEKARMLNVLSDFINSSSQNSDSKNNFIKAIQKRTSDYYRQDYPEDRVAYD